MAGERITLNPMVEDAENAPLELWDHDNGLAILEHSYPPPPADVAWAGGSDTEGEGAAAHRYKNRDVTYKVRVLEPLDAAATNLITNPSIEVAATGWANAVPANITAGATVDRDTSPAPPQGDGALRVVTSGAANEGAGIQWNAVAGRTYHLRFKYYKADAGGWVSRVSEHLTPFEDAPGSSLTLSAAAGSWVEATATFTTTRSGVYWFWVRHDAATVSAVYVDRVQIVDVTGVTGAAATPAYFDGDSAGCAWTGTRHASTSTRPATGGARFASILTDVEKYVDRVNREHAGTVRRVTEYGSRITFDVVAADLSVSSDWQFVHHRYAELELKLTCRPYGRGVETTLSDHAETTLPYLSFVETGIDGDAPALARLVVDEDEGAGQYWLVWGQQSRYYSSSANANLFYEAEGRTAQGGSAIAAGPSGASGSGSNVMRNTALASSFQSVLSTQAISAGAHLSHVGTFRVFARVQTATGNTGAVSVALEWAEGDFRRYTRNPTVAFPVGLWDATWRLVDLGIVKPTKVVAGTQRWEGRVLAKSTVAGDDIDVDYLLLVPVTEGSGEVRALTTVPAPTAFSARDEFDQTAAALTGKTLPIGGTWVGAGDADDFAVETGGHTAQRTAVSDSANTGRWATADVNLTATVVQVDFKVSPKVDEGAPKGVIARYSSTSNWLRFAALPTDFTFLTEFEVAKCVAGTKTRIAYVGVRPDQITAGAYMTLRLQVDAAGRFFAWYWQTDSPSSPVLVGVGQDSALATGGALATGDVGIYDEYTVATAYTRNYNNFAAWVPPTDAAMFASQSLELRHDRVTREDSGGTLWVQPSSYEGDYLTLPPAGREKRSNRLIVKACRNDPVTGPDSAIDNISARLSYTPRWLNVPDG